MTRRDVLIDRRAALAVIGSAALGLTALTGTQAVAADFSGKRIEWIIPFKEGGGPDTWARFYAPQIAGNLPGGPVIAVKNIPGGGSTKGAEAVFDDARAIREGGGNGSIIGRNSFQRSREDALKLLDTIVQIYLGKA